jgi:hypothetical protein
MTAQHPSQFRMGADMALNENCVFLWVNAAGNVLSKLFNVRLRSSAGSGVR